MPTTNPNKPMCIVCGIRNAHRLYKGLCNSCYQDRRPNKTKEQRLQELKDLPVAMKAAATDEDWKRLAERVGKVAEGIATGEIKATAAQSSMIRIIWERAYGRVTKSQEEKAGASGIVVLPTLSTGRAMEICLKCQEHHFKENHDGRKITEDLERSS